MREHSEQAVGVARLHKAVDQRLHVRILHRRAVLRHLRHERQRLDTNMNGFRLTLILNLNIIQRVLHRRAVRRPLRHERNCLRASKRGYGITLR